MTSRIKPLKDLYFRFIRGTGLEGSINAQDLAVILASHGYIELIAHHSKPSIEHYRETKPITHTELSDLLASR